MGILDSVLGGLPSLSSISNRLTSEAVSSAVKPVSNIVVTNLAPLNDSVSYAMAPVNQLVSEAKGAINSTFGDITLPFNAVANGLNIVSSSTISEVASSTAINEAGGGSAAGSTSYKVKLVAEGDEVAFDMTPDVAESISVDYEPLSPPQMPGEFMKYRGTKATTWTITATLTCRTRAEASLRYRDILILRGWSKTFFGDKQKTDIFGGKSKLGAPPPVVQFSGWRGVVGPVPTVMTSLQITWPRDVDWIQTNYTEDGTSELIPFPTVMQCTINLTESFSADQFNSFDLAMFKNGKMVGAWGGSTNTNSSGEAVGSTNTNPGLGISMQAGTEDTVDSSDTGNEVLNNIRAQTPSSNTQNNAQLKLMQQYDIQLSNAQKAKANLENILSISTDETKVSELTAQIRSVNENIRILEEKTLVIR